MVTLPQPVVIGSVYTITGGRGSSCPAAVIGSTQTAMRHPTTRFRYGSSSSGAAVTTSIGGSAHFVGAVIDWP